MKKLPSFGFLYLVIVMVGSILFFKWIITEGWYDRINTPSQTKKDLLKYAQYLEKIVDEFDNESIQEDILLKMEQQWTFFQNKEKLLQVYSKLIKISPGNKEYLMKLIPLLPADDDYYNEDIAKQLYSARYLDKSVLNVLLSLLVNGDSSIDQDALISELSSNRYEFFDYKANRNILLFNLSVDGWSTNQDPFFIIIKNPHKKTIKVNMELACLSNKKYMPVVAKIEGLGEPQEIIFNKNKKIIPLSFTVNSEETVLLKGNTDKTWRAPNDPRKLGVNVKVVNIEKIDPADI